MRLIDADAFIEQVKADIKEMQVPEFIMAAEAFTNDIARRPTIEAIPIEWISQWLLKNCYDKNGHYNGGGYDTVGDMLEDWEKENGTENN